MSYDDDDDDDDDDNDDRVLESNRHWRRVERNMQ